MTDFTVRLKKAATVEEINAAMKKAALIITGPPKVANVAWRLVVPELVANLAFDHLAQRRVLRRKFLE